MKLHALFGAAACIAAAAAAAPARASPCAPAAAPCDACAPPAAASGLSFGMRETLDVARTAGATFVGLSGFDLDLGLHLGDRLTVGASVDYDLMIDFSNSQLWNRVRVGGEVRYAYHHTPRADAGWGWRNDWVGARAGEQTSPGDDTHGRFAELELGTDLATDITSLGMYGAVGRSTERTPAGATLRATFATLGFRFSFG